MSRNTIIPKPPINLADGAIKIIFQDDRPKLANISSIRRPLPPHANLLPSKAKIEIDCTSLVEDRRFGNLTVQHSLEDELSRELALTTRNLTDVEIEISRFDINNPLIIEKFSKILKVLEIIQGHKTVKFDHSSFKFNTDRNHNIAEVIRLEKDMEKAMFEGILILLDYFSDNIVKPMESLSLKGCILSSKQFIMLNQWLRSDKTLISLDISNFDVVNRFEYDTALKIAQALEKNTTIEKLSLTVEFRPGQQQEQKLAEAFFVAELKRGKAIEIVGVSLPQLTEERKGELRNTIAAQPNPGAAPAVAASASASAMARGIERLNLGS